MKRWPEAIVLAASAALAILWLPSLLESIYSLPQGLRDHPVEWTAAVVGTGYVLASTLVRLINRGKLRAPWLASAHDRSEIACTRLVDRGLLVFFGALAVIWLATWLPHYVSCPWCRDEDTFAVRAQT